MSCHNVVARTVWFQIIADMPQGRIQPRTWFVEFGLAVSAAPAFAADRSELELPTAVPPSDSEIRMGIKDVMDTSSQSGRRIRSLQHVSFAYKSKEQIQLTLHWILLATHQMLWMWSGSFMVPSPFWIQLLCVHGSKTLVSSTSNGPQSPSNKAPVATGGSTI